MWSDHVCKVRLKFGHVFMVTYRVQHFQNFLDSICGIVVVCTAFTPQTDQRWLFLANHSTLIDSAFYIPSFTFDCEMLIKGRV